MAVQREQEVVVKAWLLKMKRFAVYIFVLSSVFGYSQKKLSKLLNEYNTERIPYITVNELATQKEKIVLLDSRELKEYKVSHLKDAIFVGYDNFNLDETTTNLRDKQQTIVVYCSLGIRSEDIAEKLKKAGYKNVYNLYGGIFEWKNKNFKVYNSKEVETEKVHTFNEEWSKWLKKGIKIYD